MTKTAVAGGFDDDAFRRLAEAAAQIARVNAPAFEALRESMEAVSKQNRASWVAIHDLSHAVMQLPSSSALADALEKLRGIQQLQGTLPWPSVSQALTELRLPDSVLQDLTRAVAELPSEEIDVPGAAVAAALERSIDLVADASTSEGDNAAEESVRALTPAQRGIARERAGELIICLVLLAALLDFHSLRVPAALMELIVRMISWYRATEGGE